MTRHANRAARALLALVAALAGALIAAGPVAAATPATAFGDGSTWRAIVNGPSGPDPAAGWEQPGFDDASWPELRGPFGNEDGSCGFPAPATSFPNGGRVFVRKTFTLPAGAHALHISGTVDNYSDVWVNGHLVASKSDGYCNQGGIQADVDDAYLNPNGPNVVAAWAADYGFVSYFDLQATYLAPDDATPPDVVVPADETIEATGPSGAVATFSATADDAVDGSVPASCSPASGSSFGFGTTRVTCTASDAAGNDGSAHFDVTVRDTTPPTVTVPGDRTLDATGRSGAVTTFGATADDTVDGPLPASCSPASGSTFAIGDTVVTCSARDAHGNPGRASFRVHVAGAAAQLDALASLVAGLGPGNSLSATTQSAQSALARDNTSAACGSLNALGNKARAQSGKSLTTAQAARIESDAARIGNVVGC